MHDVEDLNVAAPVVRLRPMTMAVRSVLAAGLSLGMGQVRAGELPIPKAALVSLGRADQMVSGNKMTINQYSRQAILNWEKFNIGVENTVEFRQPGASSVALNRIFQSDPSAIMGKLQANGQVFLLNPNGFVFGKDSRVNVNSLVASTLNISDDTFQKGFTKVFNQDGRAALEGTGQVYRLNEKGEFVLDGQGQKIKTSIEFQKGSEVNAAKSGRIIVAAPSVVNRGTLRAPEGQIIAVASSDKVYLQEAQGDPSLRGLVVEVANGGDVTNLGKMVSNKGNTTLLGFAVNQKGIVSASTSVQANGSVRLLAREGATARREGNKWLLQPSRTQRTTALDDGLGTRAKVTLAKGSLTQATPDQADLATAVDGLAQTPSRIEVMGKEIEMEGGAVIRSNAGRVTLSATENPADPAQPNVKNDSKVTIASGALIDVSGIKNVNVPISRNIVELELRSNELRDAPLQKTGVLYGQKIRVDIREGTPIADITGALDRIARTVAERSTQGGSLDIVSEGKSTLAAGSVLDYSGGSVLWTPGYINTTKLIGPDGRSVVDISKANPNVKYLGIVGGITQYFPSWNFSQTAKVIGPVDHVEPAYIEGKSAGSLNIKTALLSLESEMQAAAVNGTRQRMPETQALGGQLSIDLARTQTETQAVVFGRKKKQDDLQLNADRLKASGLNSLAVNTNAAIAVQSGQTIQVSPGGKVSLKGGEVNLDGNVIARSGEVELQTHLVGNDDSITGAIRLGEASMIDTSGIWNNDRPAVSDRKDQFDASLVRIDGGKVSIKAEGDVDLTPGSFIDVSGAAHRLMDKTITAGDAGAISIVAAAIDGSDVSLGGQMTGYAVAGGKGGSLSLTSDRVIIGNQPAKPVGKDEPKPLRLGSEFFTQGGFQSYSIGSNKSGVAVTDSTKVKVSVQNRIVDASAMGRKSGENLRLFSRVETLPDLIQPAGDLALKLSQQVGFGGKNAAVSIGKGAELATNVGGKLSVSSDGSILLNGGLTAKAGEVNLNITPPSLTDAGFLPNQGVWLGATAKLDVGGVSRIYQDGFGRARGEVLDGGKITIHADRGFIESQAGSLMNVAGTADYLDIPVKGSNLSQSSGKQLIASAGGQIELRAAEGMQIMGNLQASGGGPGAAGGDLRVELNPFTRNEPDQIVPGQLPFPRVPSIISLAQGDAGGVIPTQGTDIPELKYGRAYLSASRLARGGFSTLAFKTPDQVEFTGDVQLTAERSITLDASVLSWNPAAKGAGAVNLKAPYIALGSTQTRPGKATPSQGKGTLTASAGLIDLVGSSATQGFGSTYLSSSSDMRLVGVRINQQQRDFLGEFLTGGYLTLTSKQLYPTTLSDFRVAIQGNPDATLTVARTTAADPNSPPPLSAGGKLTLEAPNIVQSGTLLAPLGQINFKAGQSLSLTAGSITSNSAAGALIPFGRVQGGLDWIYPLGQQNLVLSAPPAKRISLDGNSVTIADGARIDSKGGGDLFAYEHIPGLGGSFDVLDPGSKGYKGSFAIIPNYTATSAPVDPLELPTSGLKVGDSIYLSGGGGLAAGSYTLLPAHYALLPGAYLVTPKAGYQDMMPGRNLVTANGGSLVAGYRTVAGTEIRDARWSGYVVETGQNVRQRAEYNTYTANRFYTDRAVERGTPAPYLPKDGGALTISANKALNLDGQITAAGSDGARGGRLDIAAENIAVVAQSGAASGLEGAIKLVDKQLNALDVSSLFLGGIRTESDDGTDLGVKAANVRLNAGVNLQGQEVILAARDDITLKAGASLSTSQTPGQLGSSPSTYRVEGDSAFLRVGKGGQSSLKRSNVSGTTGSITVEKGATVAASGSVMLDATAENTLSGNLLAQGASVALGAKRISVGQVDDSASGLILTQGQLNALKANTLILSSGSDISLYGAARLNAQQLVLHSAGLLGFSNDNQTASLSGGSIWLDNNAGVTTGLSGDGTGGLRISAKNLTLGQGDYSLGGFGEVSLDAAAGLAGHKEGTLNVRSNLTVTTPRISGGRGADTSIDATGYAVTLEGAKAKSSKGVNALGARLAVTADSILQSTQLAFPSGTVSLNALRGDLELGDGSSIDVSGRTVELGKNTLTTAGGAIELAAETGNVRLSDGSQMLLGGAQGGTLSVEVPNGEFKLAGKIDAQGQTAGGRFSLDVGDSAALGGLGTLAEGLRTAGLTDTVRLNARNGDWNLNAGESLEARLVALVAERGALGIDGAITARGADAAVELTAADALRLGSGSKITAQGTAGHESRLTIAAVDSDSDGNGGIVLESGAKLEVQDQDGKATGEVAFRTDRSGQDVAFEGDIAGAVTGSARTTLEAVKVYQKSGTISASDIATWKSETDAFMANMDGIEGRLGLQGGLLAGLDIRSQGNLTLGNTGWDLVDWRYGGRAGVLSLTAADTLNINGKLTDGFRDEPNGIDISAIAGPGTSMPVKDMLQTGESWSFRLNARDDVRVADNNFVRTGTGDIEVNVGQDLVLSNAGSAIYTAGRADAANRYGSFKNSFVAYNFFGEYPIEGGDIRIQAGRDVVGAKTGQFFDGWMSRTGTWREGQDHAGQVPTAWSVAIGGPVGTSRPQSSFNQNLGALGGGNVTVEAGRNVLDLSAVIPTTGKQVGEVAKPDDPRDPDFKTNVVEVNGGGNLAVRAGGDVLGGVFYTGRGTADINAGGSIKAGPGENDLAPVLALGDARFNLKAGNDIELAAAINPTVINDTRGRNYFFTYTGESGIGLAALAGNVTLHNNTGKLIDTLNGLRPSNNQLRFPGVSQEALSVYPASLRVAALQGDIVIGNSFVNFPSAKGDFSLQAGGNIVSGSSGNNVNVTLSDTDPALLPSVNTPATSWEDAFQRLQPFGDSNLIHAKAPMHQGDTQPAVIYAKRDLRSNDALLFSLSKAAEVEAGRDIFDVSFQIQHPEYALTRVTAGRDVVFTTPRNDQGNLVNLTRELRVAGPGQLWLTSGRNIDLGASQGAYSIGNTDNSALPERGASINLQVGVGKGADWSGFAKRYDPLSSKYAADLVAYMSVRLDKGSLGYAEALSAYKSLPEEQRREFLLKVLYREVRDSATQAAKSGKVADYDAGYAAIDALFPGAGGSGQYRGDLKLFFSKIHTVDGGDINMMVPGGLVNAGLAVAFAGSKSASDLGIVAQREGDINGVVDGNFLVNQSRVFALDGGDITLWSSNGNIDAGRGSKASLAVPPPIISFDEQGNLKVELPPAVSGSGIRTAASTVANPGDVTLAAPRGVVDAGEAGIGGSNITIAATAVIGASNIDVGGSSTGVPTATVSVPVAPAGAAAAATAATNTSTETAESAVNNATNQANEKNELPERLAADVPARLNPLQVDILGFGECGVADVKEGKPGCV